MLLWLPLWQHSLSRHINDVCDAVCVRVTQIIIEMNSFWCRCSFRSFCCCCWIPRNWMCQSFWGFIRQCAVRCVCVCCCHGIWQSLKESHHKCHQCNFRTYESCYFLVLTRLNRLKKRIWWFVRLDSNERASHISNESLSKLAASQAGSFSFSFLLRRLLTRQMVEMRNILITL